MKKLSILILLVVATVCAHGQVKSSNPNFGKADMRNSTPRVVVIVAHPNLKESKANAALLNVAKEMKLDIIDLYKEKSFNIEAHREAITNATTVVFQFPLYFGGAPYKLKQWIDEVFYTFVEGPMLNGKTLMIATTTGSEEEAYRSGGRNQFTMDELLRPYQMTANYSGMRWATPFIVYGMSTDEAEKNLNAGVKEYQRVLEKVGRAKVGSNSKMMKSNNTQRIDDLKSRDTQKMNSFENQHKRTNSELKR